MKLPWIGNTSLQLIELIKRSINRCSYSVKLYVVLKSDLLLPPNLKDSMTILQKSFLICKLLYKCLLYRLHDAGVRHQNISTHPFSYSHQYLDLLYSIKQSNSTLRNLLDNPTCAVTYNLFIYSILESCSNELHLSILLVLLIARFEPELCTGWNDEIVALEKTTWFHFV